MSRRRKATTSNELIRENCEWPMTVGEVAKLTGLSRFTMSVGCSARRAAAKEWQTTASSTCPKISTA